MAFSPPPNEVKPSPSWVWLRHTIAWNTAPLLLAVPWLPIALSAGWDLAIVGEAVVRFVIIWSLTGIISCIVGACLPDSNTHPPGIPRALGFYRFGLHFLTGPIGLMIFWGTLAPPSGWVQWTLLLVLGPLAGMILTFYCLIFVVSLVRDGFKTWIWVLGHSVRGSIGAPAEEKAQPSVEERLTKLDELRSKQLITEQEYQARRIQVLQEV